MPLLCRVRERIHQDPRLARIIHGGLSGIFGRGIGVVVSAIILPLTVRYLGNLEYGIWITISTTVVMINVLDLGIANTLTNLISEAYAHNDRQGARAYFATAVWATAILVVVLAVACIAVWRVVNWGSLMHLTDPVLIERTRTAVLIAILFFCFSMPLNLANRVLAGYQQVHISNYFSMVSSAFSLIAVVVGILARGNLVVLMAAYCSALLAGGLLLNIWLLFFEKPWILPSWRAASAPVVRMLFRQGWLFFLLQLTTIVVFNSDNIVITHYRGADEVTPYSIAWRLANYAAMFQQILVLAVWPALTEAYQKLEMDWLRSTYKILVRKTFLAVSLGALIIGLIGRPLIRVWAGSSSVPSGLLLWTMAAWAVLVCVTTNQALLLTATGRLKVEAASAVCAAIVNLVLSIVLVQRIGPEGVILSTILSFLVCMLLPQQREVRRILRGDFLASRSSAKAVPKLYHAEGES